MSAISNVFTVKDAAEMLGVSEARIRRICLDLDIGSKVGTVRLFTDADMEQLKALPRQVGRPRKDAG